MTTATGCLPTCSQWTLLLCRKRGQWSLEAYSYSCPFGVSESLERKLHSDRNSVFSG